MNSEYHEPASRLHELVGEYEALGSYLDEAIRRHNDEKVVEIKEQQNRLLAEIRELDPEFEE